MKFDVVPVLFRYIKVAIAVHDSILLPHQKWYEECWWLTSDNLQWSRWPMFLHVKVEKKFRHYTLSSREWINVLYVTPISEDPPLGLIDRQSRLSLGSTDTWGNIDRKASAAEGILDTLQVCSWRLDGLQWIWPWGWDSNPGILGILSGDCTNIPKSSHYH